MFSDLDRSQSWQVQQHTQQQLAQQQQHVQPYATERQSQSGWFPLEDALLVTSQSQPQVGYADDEQLLCPQPQDVGRWATQTTDHQSYVHEVGRLSIPSRPEPPAMYPPGHTYTPSSSGHELGLNVEGDGAYAAWPHDSRLPSPSSASIHSHVVVDQFEDQFADRPQQYGGMVTMTMARPPQPRGSRKAKEISIGRWNADEHKWFLKGLEMFAGPAWGEIARLIGSRTSTQVRTHAQKFFTKLARMGQTLPYFDAQIQKERARLLAQGALPGANVTPTSTSGFSYALTNLSPRKRVSSSGGDASPSKHDVQESSSYTTSTTSSSQYNSTSGAPLPGNSYETQSRLVDYDDHARTGGGAMAYYHQHHAPPDETTSSNNSSSNAELFKPKYDISGGMSPLLRKPRMYIDASGHPVSAAAVSADPVPQYDSLPHQQQYQHQHVGYASAYAKDDFDAPRPPHFAALDAPHHHSFQHQQQLQQLTRSDDMGYALLHHQPSAAAGDPWTSDDSAQRQWLSLPPASSAYVDVDADSLPSMDKLLYRGAAA